MAVFEVGEVAIYWREGSPYHKEEVIITHPVARNHRCRYAHGETAQWLGLWHRLSCLSPPAPQLFLSRRAARMLAQASSGLECPGAGN
jgi:hypothetical protein